MARKQYSEFSDNIDLIDTLPPGLYEATFTKRSADIASPDLVSGDWVMRCEARTLDDIRALGGNDAEDERRFATAARVSETNLALYRTYMQPFVRAFANPMMAEWMRNMHPLRLQYEMFSDANPFMAPIKAAAEKVRSERKPVSLGQPVPRHAGKSCRARSSTASMPGARPPRRWPSARFLAVYGSPVLQAACGIDAGNKERNPAQGRDEPAASPAGGNPDCGASLAYRQGRPSRSHGARRALYRHGAQLRG